MKRQDALIEAEELLGKIADPNLRIYDATILFFRQETDQTAYEKYLDAHIPGAAFFDHEAFSDSNHKYQYMILPAAALMAQIGQIGISPETEVIFYTSEMLPCATRAWWLLHYAGHNKVRVLNGGLAAWQAAGGEIAQGGHQYAPAVYGGQIRPDRLADKEAVLAAIDDDAICTVNTLTQEWFDKEHIQGSILRSCFNLMSEMTAFLPDDQLAAQLQDQTQASRVITYCGGGIAATTSALAHLIAGNPNVAIYDGSLDEWTGEDLPMTRASQS
jgi:thiosulfate/3-mercaptopyruvate sulfurtransferase